MQGTLFRFPWYVQGLTLALCAACNPSADDASNQTTSVRPAMGKPQSDSAWDKEDLARFVDGIMERQMKKEHIPGAAISIVKDGAILLARGYGVADVERREQVDPNTTIFRIGSVSKAVTALAIVQLSDKGLLDLDKDVNLYLKNVKVGNQFSKPVTGNHLLTHTGGFDQPGRDRNFKDAALRPSLAEFLERDLTRIRPPGEQSCYDTYGISLAGYLLESVSGKSYAEYMRQDVFEPLGMTRTFVETPAELSADLAIGYHHDGTNYVRENYEYYASTPASSIDSTVVDMAQLMIAVLGNGSNNHGSLFSPESARQIKGPQYRLHSTFARFAFGFWETLAPEGRIIHHGGTMRGYSSNLVLMPSQGVGTFVAINRDSETGPSTRLVYSIVEQLHRRWFAPKRRDKQTSPQRVKDTTNRFAGRYIPNLYCHLCYEGDGWGPSDAITKVEALDDGVIRMNGRTYYAVGPLLFRNTRGELSLVFTEADDGTITGFGLKQDLPGTTHEKLDENLLHRVLGPDWASRRQNPLAALVYRANGQWREASEAYYAIAANRPAGSMSRALALYRLGECSLEAGKTKEASRSLSDARAILQTISRTDELRGGRTRRLAARTLLLESAARSIMNELDLAFALIHEAIDQYGLPAGEIAMDLKASPYHKNLLEDPRFAALERR